MAQRTFDSSASDPSPHDQPPQANAAQSSSGGEESTKLAQVDSSVADAGAAAPPAADPRSGAAPASRTFMVDPAGAGEFTSLSEAMEQVPPGARLRLAAGEHRLREPLVVAKTVTWEGAGREATRVVCDGAEFVVQVQGAEAFATQGITFQHLGNQPADVLVIHSLHQPDAARLRFRGERRNESTNGDGLSLRGTTSGTITACVARHNFGCGILLADHTHALLEGNTCARNKRSGLVYADSASGTARNNTCQGNALNGITVLQQARPVLEGNHYDANGKEPVYVEPGAKPQIHDAPC